MWVVGGLVDRVGSMFVSVGMSVVFSYFLMLVVWWGHHVGLTYYMCGVPIHVGC